MKLSSKMLLGPRKNKIKLDDEAKKNLVELFELLFKIDRRINPQNYKTPKFKEK